MDMPAPTKLTSLRERLALRGIDGVTLLVLPSVIFTLAIFIYPFIYGLILSFQPINGTGALANYIAFFSDPFLYNTIWATLRLSLPATIGYMCAGLMHRIDGLPPFSVGYVNFLAAGLIVPTAMILAPVGVKISHAMPRAMLRRVFAVVLMIVTARMLLSF